VEECGSGEPLLLLRAMMGTGGDRRHLFDLDVLYVVAYESRFHCHTFSARSSWP
jgi:hypothetical protein